MTEVKTTWKFYQS